jgi:hypothetical protein
MNSDELETSNEKFNGAAFCIINIKGKEYYLPSIKLKGVFASDIQRVALNNNLIIPSLGEMVTYINSNDSGSRSLRTTMKKYPIISSTSMQREEDSRWISISEANNDLRKKMGFPVIEKRFTEYDFHGYVKLVQTSNAGNLEKDIIEKLFNNDYSTVMNALRKLSSHEINMLFIPKSTAFQDATDNNNLQTIFKCDDTLIIKEYQVQRGNYSLR